MKILFFGTPEFAVPSLRELSSHFDVSGVVTKEDKPSGRGLKVIESPVKKTASDLDIPIFQPKNLEEFKDEFYQIDPDICIVIAYGKIIPDWILEHKKGVYNLHASLLPKYRGAAPIQRAIMDDQKETGITLQKMVSELDAGDISAQKIIIINDDDTAGSLHDELSIACADLLSDTLPKLDSIEPVKQNPKEVSWAQKITKDDAIIKWQRTHIEIYNQIRALNPHPGARTRFFKNDVKIWQSKLNDLEGLPGQVVEASKRVLTVGCGEGSLDLEIIQPSNKNKIKGFEFASNLKLKKGDILI